MITFAYDCPYCGAQNTGFEIKGEFFHQKDDPTWGNSYKFSLMAVCNRCKNAIVTNTPYLSPQRIRIIICATTTYKLGFIMSNQKSEQLLILKFDS
ncbi:hypothetical protein [Rodentibacter caecimuris]|uniref:hypothetical protein n=1 Tax=Rodentibacter caecimuris TaxID=1796644 RepID=UPI0013A09D67|nr:hypothetical protein [Rodentibacter heylii]QIA76142.1 hypothetical protein FEE42_01595 [Rodentibacter heylii]QIA76685.1 hypothetical protein FEE42_04595 [Rodentibacter heylii]